MRPRTPVGSAAAFLVVFGAAFAAPGIWMWRDALGMLRTWPEAEARSAGSEVVSYPGKNGTLHRARYVLRYSVAGTAYEVPLSSRSSSSSRARAAREAERYEEGSLHRIRHDPAEPFDARDDVGPNVRFFLLPALFTGVGASLVAIGGALLIWKWRRGPGPRCPACLAPVARDFRHCPRCGSARAGAKPEAPVDETWDEAERAAIDVERAPAELGEARRNRTGNRVGGSVFAALGIAFLIGAAVLGWRLYEVATRWPRTEGVVTRSELERGRDREGERTFRPGIELRYEVEGREHRSAASLDGSGRYAWARRLVEQNPIGSRRLARYNPSAANEVRLDAAPHFDALVLPAAFGVLGAVFAPLGLALLYQGFLVPIVVCGSCRRVLSRKCRFCPHCGAPAAAGPETVRGVSG